MGEDDPTRRLFLRTLLAGAGGGLAGCSIGAVRTSTPGGTDSSPTTAATRTAQGGATATATRTEPPTTTDAAEPAVGLEPVVEGIEMPVGIVFPPDAPDRRYVAEQSGRIRVHETDGLRDEPLLDLREAVVTSFEQGLLGLALHPSFPDDRRLFVRYSAPPRDGTPADYSHTFVLASFEVSADGRLADPASERTILEIPEPGETHNAGDIVFGPDGYLYVGVGDGGGENDRGTGHVADWYDAVPGGNGQDVTENLLGSVLRLDVDAGGDGGYGIPQDNPLVGEEGLDEHYAWGFRNPWRMSFDRGTLYVGDVGQSSSEEINRVERGGNYGWNVREGTRCVGVDDCPDETPDGRPLRDPVIEYPNWKRTEQPVSGAAVISGYRYRGSAVPELQDTFVFGDWVARGRLFAATPATGGQWPTDLLRLPADDRSKLYTLNSFGRDRAGELYVLSSAEQGAGGVYRLVPADAR